jgi:hypothetical protein
MQCRHIHRIGNWHVVPVPIEPMDSPLGDRQFSQGIGKTNSWIMTGGTGLAFRRGKAFIKKKKFPQLFLLSKARNLNLFISWGALAK